MKKRSILWLSWKVAFASTIRMILFSSQQNVFGKIHQDFSNMFLILGNGLPSISG